MDCQLVNKKYRVCKQRDPTTSLHKQTNKQTNIELYTQADRSYTYNSMENSQINGFTQPLNWKAWGKNPILWGHVGVNGSVYLPSIHKVVCLYNKSNVLMSELQQTNRGTEWG